MNTPTGAHAASHRYRDVAIGGAGAIVLTVHILGQSWFPAAVAVVAAAAWLVAEHRPVAIAPWITQVAFVILGALLIWRFTERLLWLTTAGFWLLAAAADLARLSRRFPVDASPLDQRLLLGRRLQHLGLLAVVAAAVVGASLALTLSLRLMALALLAVFVVMVLVRLFRSVDQGELPSNDDEPGGVRRCRVRPGAQPVRRA